MKKMRVCLIGLIVSMSFFSCDEILNVLDINFDSEPVYVDVYVKATPIGEYVDTNDVIISDIKDEIENHEGSWEDVGNITISSIHVELLTGAENFNSLKNFELKVQAGNKAEKVIAWHNDIPMNVDEFTPEFTSDNLIDYILEDSYKVYFNCLVREDMAEDVTFRVTVEYHVEI